ncbi:hypothetical protein PTKIN_Ptkin07bG0265200 [Pterospermum kingtungense]
MLNDKKVAALTQEMYTRGSDYWKNAIVAQFIGKISNFSYFHRMGWSFRVWTLAYSESPTSCKALGTMSRPPVWLHLRNVPLELFTQDGLSCIVSVIGNPLYMDRITTSQKRLAYAKVCIELRPCLD